MRESTLHVAMAVCWMAARCKLKQRVVAVGLATLSGVASGAGGHPGHGVHWGYEGDFGPAHWASLQPEFSACSGKNQSPIDVAVQRVAAEMKPIRFDYKAGGHEVVNNGHTIQVNMEAGSSITVDDIPFDLKQFHFHSPSENHIGGKSFPLEAHLVHADEQGNLAVVAVMFEEGKDNAIVGTVWSHMPKGEGKNALPGKVSASGLLPEKRAYYRYSGSLTTPPCSEGVRWIVLKEPMTVTRDQLAAFRETLGFANNRPVQPINARFVLE
jgi:carbonic anhydrase